jgi:sodium transport system ATP-binding protein
MIEIEQLSKRFTQGRGRQARTVQALDGVGFTAPNGLHHGPAGA